MARTRCNCKQLSFQGLRSFAQRNGITEVGELIRQTGCCTGCGTCRPYLEDFLRTGEIRYDGQSFKLPDFLQPRKPRPPEPNRAAPPPPEPPSPSE